MRSFRHISSHIILGLLIAFLAVSCEKVEGEGGRSSITGKIYIMEYNSMGQLNAEYYAPDEEVYIIYGNSSTIYNDDFKTSFDGSYRFDYLAKGSYTVFAYSECDTCQSGVVAVMKEVEVSGKDTGYMLEDIVLRK